MKMSKKGQADIFGNLTAVGIGLTVMVVLFAVLFLVIANTRTQIESMEGLNGEVVSGETSIAWNASRTISEAADDIPDWLPLIVIVVLGGLIIGLVAKFGGGGK